VYWTKFECISDKIRRILTNDLCASAALDKLAWGKTKNFLPFKISASRRGVWGEPQIKMIGNFWFYCRRYRIELWYKIV
jgi:hypothetical protein